MMNRIPAVGEAVELIADPFYHKNPFKKGMRGIVTGHKRPRGDVTDVIINGDKTNSVDVTRVVGLGSRIYRMTNKRGPKQYEVAGCLLDDLAPGDLFVFYACDLTGKHAGQGYCLRYLNRKQVGLHYTDEQWVKDLLECGAIEDYLNPLAHEEPQEFTSIALVPRGMVVQYTIDGHSNSAMLYPYIYRSAYGVYVCTRDDHEWVFVKWSDIAKNHPWLLRLPTDFGVARLTEAFVYPHFPAMLRLQQWSIINAE